MDLPDPDQDSSPNDPDVVELKPHRPAVIRIAERRGERRRLSILC
jgi:hypothetical protein